MHFVFSNSPTKIIAMTRPMAWAALNAGYDIAEECSSFDEHGWSVRLQNPEMDIPTNPFAYGHTGLVAAISAGRCPQGAGWHVAWNAQDFDTMEWSRRYGDLMWNHASVRFMTLQEALEAWPTEGWHMRPSGVDSGPKAFKAFFADKAGFAAAWAKSTSGFEKNQSMRVAVSQARLPAYEYRLVFMRDEYVAGSLYLTDGRLTLSPIVPAPVHEFASRVARSHSLPSTHCVVDVGVGACGAMGIIEFNSLHSSGLYACDRERIVEGIARTWATP